MCGIFGFFHPHMTHPKPLLEKALGNIAHRGPNFSSSTYEKNLFLGHTRLSILDLDPRSNQPFNDDQNGIELVFNGEIYNYQELKKDLKDYNFRTTSDTEVIIAGYLKWGLGSLEKFRGMFAFAIHDKRNNKLIIARDHVGKKPLFFFRNGLSFAFASEIKCFFDLPEFKKKISHEGLNFYLSYGYTPADKTFFQDVVKLRPGHFMVLDLDTQEIKDKQHAYYNLPFTRNEKRPVQSEEEVLRNLKNLLIESLELRMRSDVPVGTFLSGGVDSSLIAILCKVELGMNLPAFTVSIPGTAADEADWAKRITSKFGIQHHLIPLEQDYESVMARVIPLLDEPFADSSFVPTYMVSAEASKYLKVILSGDGGDELFCGYEHYRYLQIEQKLRKRLGPLTSAVGHLSLALPDRHKTQILKRLRFGTDFKSSLEDYYQRFFNLEDRKKLLGTETLNGPASFVNETLHLDIPWEESLCHYDFRNYMVDDILVKVDRMSMLNGLEVRSPLLDIKLAEFAFNTMPFEYKNKKNVLKYPLKALLRRYLGDEYNYGRKQGFGVPLSEWFKGRLADPLKELIQSQSVLNRTYSLKLIKEHQQGYSNHSKKLFNLYVLLEWLRKKEISL